MGTRGAIGFRMNGEDKVTYNHFDSYPSGLGAEILMFVKNHKVEDMKRIVPEIKLVNEQDQPTPEEKLACRRWTNFNVSSKSDDDWYCLLRDAQGRLESFVDEGLRYMIDSQLFLVDSLFCEWAYIINLDTDKLEVYKGFNKDPKAAGRYAALQDGPRYDGDPLDYFGVMLLVEYPLKDAANMTVDEFVKEVEKLAGYNDEEE